MLLVNQNNVVDAKSVNASLIALKNQADKLNRQIIALEKSIKSLDGSKADEKDLSNYYTKGETYNKTEVYNTSEITSNYYNKQSVDTKISDALADYDSIVQKDTFAECVSDYKNKTFIVLNGKDTANRPSSIVKHWFIETKKSTVGSYTYVEQVATSFAGDTSVANVEYRRIGYTNSDTYTFGTWQKLATESDLNSVTWDNGTTWTSINTNVCNGSNLYNLYIKHGNSIMYQLTGWIRVKAGTYSAGTKVFDLPHKAKINTYLHGAKSGIVSPDFYQLYVDNNKTEVVFNQTVTFSAETIIQFNTLICTTDN